MSTKSELYSAAVDERKNFQILDINIHLRLFINAVMILCYSRAYADIVRNVQVSLPQCQST